MHLASGQLGRRRVEECIIQRGSEGAMELGNRETIP